MTWAAVITLAALGALLVAMGTFSLRAVTTGDVEADEAMTPALASVSVVLGGWLLLCAAALWDRYL